MKMMMIWIMREMHENEKIIRKMNEEELIPTSEPRFQNLLYELSHCVRKIQRKMNEEEGVRTLVGTKPIGVFQTQLRSSSHLRSDLSLDSIKWIYPV